MAHKPRVDINTNAYRALFPFFLTISVMLLLVWRLILSPGLADKPETCPTNTDPYFVQPGDSCWDIAKAHGISLEQFQKINPKVQCEPLMPGASVCLPDVEKWKVTMDKWIYTFISPASWFPCFLGMFLINRFGFAGAFGVFHHILHLVIELVLSKFKHPPLHRHYIGVRQF
jgi:hypothetical protein